MPGAPLFVPWRDQIGSFMTSDHSLTLFAEGLRLMKTGYPGLFIPGPTNIPEKVRQAMAIQLEDQRAPDFPQFTLPLFADLKRVFKTGNGQVFIFPGSGTAGWEAAVANTLSPGDKVLCSVFGQFSHLWADLCRRHDLDVQALEVEWGKGVPVEEYERILKADTGHRIKAGLACHNETATASPRTSPASVGLSMSPSIRRCCSSTRYPRSLPSISAWTNGASMPASRDRKRVSCCRPALPSWR